MTNEEIAKVSELIKVKTEACNSSVYMSIEWLCFGGMAYGIEEIMIELGYEWSGSSFVEVSHE